MIRTKDDQQSVTPKASKWNDNRGATATMHNHSQHSFVHKPHVTQRRAGTKEPEKLATADVKSTVDNEQINNIDAISNILNKQFFNNDEMND